MAAKSENDTSDAMVVLRFNTVGSLDTSFGNNGMFIHDNAAGATDIDQAQDIDVESAGRIVVAGYSRNGSNNDMVIWRIK